MSGDLVHCEHISHHILFFCYIILNTGFPSSVEFVPSNQLECHLDKKEVSLLKNGDFPRKKILSLSNMTSL